ncbi:MAG: hypothetical protein AAF514_18975 [Verrucomicrobiota bacterium]
MPKKTGLDSNINIELSGTLPGGSAISMTLTGCGETYTADVTTGETEIGESRIPIVTTVTYKVEKTEGAYSIEYQISARLPVPSSTTKTISGTTPTTSRTSRRGMTTNIQYRDMRLVGKIRCTPDQSVRIFQSGDQELAVKVTNAEEKTL